MSANNSNFEAPRIEPVPTGTPRPLWSVMIPTFNCAKYLRQTLESVLAQDPGAEQMQIEVVDDCSTKDDPETVVREVGKGRVAFYRKPKNEGATANFNTCIQRSRGHLVHILHGDDWVANGFYAAIIKAANEYPDTSLIAARTFGTDEHGVILWVSPRLKELESGGNDVTGFLYENRLQFAGNVVRRAFYERYGGFRTKLIHTADAEMWVRAIHLGRAVVLREPMGFYRLFAQNDTGRLARTAKNVEDLLQLNEIFAREYQDFDQRLGRQRAYNLAHTQAQRFYAANDMEAYNHNFSCWKRLTPWRVRLWHWLKSHSRIERP